MDRQVDPPSLETYLVERYWPGIDLAQLRSLLPRLEIAAEAMRAEGVAIGYVGSILMPADQVVFSLIEASSEADVRHLNERAELPLDRIATAIAMLCADPSVPSGEEELDP